MKKVLLLVLVVVVAGAASLLFTPVRAFLIAQNLPDFPDWPAPVRELGSEDSGKIYFATSSPYDLEVILGGMRHARPTTGLGYLSYPDNASAEASQ